ncbi:unnamed protein product [Alopecurus aequalis]
MARLQLIVVVLAALVTMCALAAAVDAADKKAPPPPPKFLQPGKFGLRKGENFTCSGDKRNRYCQATCPTTCRGQCLFGCPGCFVFCSCDLPGGSCGDPRFTGGDGNTFYFHGKKDQNFCVVSDAGVHINAHFIGKRNPTMHRDFTWIQALGIRFADHRLYMGAQKTVKWDDDVDRLELTFDGMPIDIPAEINEQWQSTAVPALTITRTSMANAIKVEFKGVFDIHASVVPITEEDARIHNYGVTEGDSLAHFDLRFKFYNLTDNVHGVLGQTYRTDYVNKLDVSADMPIMGGAPGYVSSDIFATDCKVARFGRQGGISMVTGQAN